MTASFIVRLHSVSVTCIGSDPFLLLLLLFNCGEAAQHDCYCVQRNCFKKKKISEKGRRGFGDFKVLFQCDYGLSDFSVLSFPRNLLDKDTFSKSDPCKYKTKDFLFLDKEYFGEFEFICVFFFYHY